MINWKEVAKFACGWEAFHAATHLFFLITGITITAFGITATPQLNLIAAVGNAIIAIALGIYAWRSKN